MSDSSQSKTAKATSDGFTKQAPPGNERRDDARFNRDIDVAVRELSAVSKTPDLRKPVIHGKIQNLSRRGVCISSKVPLTSAAVVRCDIRVADLPVSVPTLMQVRWVEKTRGQSYVSGLLYMF